ncbi:hypothetical protein T484DRAFT_1783165 [Baffinella frigidus]|nr:hypothetical protein T484DRAFT_1783165 [Cryptophyta sp. CCMP2293]
MNTLTDSTWLPLPYHEFEDFQLMNTLTDSTWLPLPYHEFEDFQLYLMKLWLLFNKSNSLIKLWLPSLVSLSTYFLLTALTLLYLIKLWLPSLVSLSTYFLLTALTLVGRQQLTVYG